MLTSEGLTTSGPLKVLAAMTAEQEIKAAIIVEGEEKGIFSVYEPITAENVDEIWDALYNDSETEDALSEGKDEFRYSGENTPGIPEDSSRHYECDAVAKQMPSGRWVGWMFWHGGGKHGEPEAIDWMDRAYFLDVAEEEKTVTVRTFAKVKEAPCLTTS